MKVQAMVVCFSREFITLGRFVAGIIEPLLTLPRQTAEFNVINLINHFEGFGINNLDTAPIRAALTLLIGRQIT